MRIIKMIDNYNEMCDMSKIQDKFNAYKCYTEKYPDLYDGIFKYFYMTDISNLQSMIEQCDFNSCLAKAKENINNGIVDKIVKTVNKTIKLLNYHGDFDLYIGLDLGMHGGVALPVNHGNPYAYIGIDRNISESNVESLIPHELNHMVRGAILQNIDMFDFTERVISEGLGTYCPVAFKYGSCDFDLTIEIVAEVMGLPINKTMKLMNNKNSLEKAVVNEFGTPLTAEKMSQFFMWSGDDATEYPLSGYFIGMYIIHDLITKGYTICELTAMSSQVFYQNYTK